MIVFRARGQLLKKLLDAAGSGSHALVLSEAGKVRGFATYFPASHTERDLMVCSVVVAKEHRRHSRVLLRALADTITAARDAIGEGFLVTCDSASTAGERLAKLAAKRLGCPVIDFGKLDRIINPDSQRVWQELV